MAKKTITQPPLVEDARVIKTNKGGLEIGDSGTPIYSGIISDDYNPLFRGQRAIEIFDEMRKSDGTIASIVQAVMLPILRAKWHIQPGDDSLDAEIHKEFIEKAFFELPTTTWSDTLRQALLSMPLGVNVFEKVFGIRNIDGKDYIIWEKLAPRSPRTIQAWQTETGEPGIQQRKTSGGVVSIPMDKLLIFTHQKEGDNFEGFSILRPAYKHWHIKNTLYKIDAIAAERQGLGVPFAKLPEGYSESDRAKAEAILKNMRANDQAFLIVPKGYEIGFLDMFARTTRDLSPSISHHNREITKSVLAQFLELGSDSAGSFALSKDQTSLFLQSLETVADSICDIFIRYAIKQLVDFNFQGVKEYPRLCYAGLTRVDVKNIADTYKTLIDAKGINNDAADEQYLRNLLGLPERTSDAEEMDQEDSTHSMDHADEVDDAIEEVGLSEFKSDIKKKSFPKRKEIKDSIQSKIKDKSLSDKIAFLKKNISSVHHVRGHLKDKKDMQSFFSDVNTELHVELSLLKKLSLADAEPFRSFRALTSAEKRVDFSSIEQNMDRIEDSFDEKTRELLDAEKEKFMKKLSKAVANEDTQAIKDATIAAQAAYAKIIKESMKESYEYGKNKAAKELGVDVPSNAREALARIDIQADAIAESHIAQITTGAKTAAVEALSKGESAIAALAAADAVADSIIDDVVYDTARIAMPALINTGRSNVFESNSDKIYALQRSELLDYSTCPYCLSVDGRIVEKSDPFAKNTIFHTNCRGIWVAILIDEEELPRIDGIPKSIKDRFGDVVNDLIQPRVPQTKKDSAARKEAERRAKRQANQ